jgi:hypothetical protein
MTDLNCASFTDITAAGVEPGLARDVEFWRPYRSWDDPMLLATLDDGAVAQLQNHGFKVGAPNDSAWAGPKSFKLSSETRREVVG